MGLRGVGMGLDLTELDAFLLFKKNVSEDLRLYAEGSGNLDKWGAEVGIEWRF